MQAAADQGIRILDPKTYDVTDADKIHGGPTAQEIDGRFFSTSGVNSVENGLRADMLEGQRHLTPSY